MRKRLNDLNELLRDVISEAKALNIPVSNRIVPKVRVNNRAIRRFGCIAKNGEFIIEISGNCLTLPNGHGQTLAHEVLHTCPGCKTTEQVKQYAKSMNSAYDYDISRASTHELALRTHCTFAAELQPKSGMGVQNLSTSEPL